MRSGAEVEQALHAFVKRWKNYDGSERAEAPTTSSRPRTYEALENLAIAGVLEQITG